MASYMHRPMMVPCLIPDSTAPLPYQQMNMMPIIAAPYSLAGKAPSGEMLSPNRENSNDGIASINTPKDKHTSALMIIKVLKLIVNPPFRTYASIPSRSPCVVQRNYPCVRVEPNLQMPSAAHTSVEWQIDLLDMLESLPIPSSFK